MYAFLKKKNKTKSILQKSICFLSDFHNQS